MCQREDDCSVAPLKQGGQPHADSQFKAHILKEKFTANFTFDEFDTHADTKMEGPSIPPIKPLVINVAGVVKLLKDINVSKAGGPGEVPSRFL